MSEKNRKQIEENGKHLELLNVILKAPLSLSDKFVFSFICQIFHIRFCNGQYPLMDWSNKSIARQIHLTIMSVDHSIQHLSHLKLIKYRIKGRKQRCNGTYRIIMLTQIGKGYCTGKYERIPNYVLKQKIPKKHKYITRIRRFDCIIINACMIVNMV